jgi:uncharacterized protein YwqG
MMWGDAGRIFFGIERADLAATDFTDVWSIFENH